MDEDKNSFTHPSYGTVIGFSVQMMTEGLYIGSNQLQILRNVISKFFSERGLDVREESYFHQGRGAAGPSEVLTAIRLLLATYKWFKEKIDIQKQRKFRNRNLNITVWLRLYGRTYLPKELKNYEITQFINLSRMLGQDIKEIYSDQIAVNFRISVATQNLADHCLSFEHAEIIDIPSYKLQKLALKMKPDRSYELHTSPWPRLKEIPRKQAELEIRC